MYLNSVCFQGIIAKNHYHMEFQVGTETEFDEQTAYACVCAQGNKPTIFSQQQSFSACKPAQVTSEEET